MKNGYRLRLNTLRDLWNLIDNFRTQARGALREAVCLEMALVAAQVIDNQALDRRRVIAGISYETSDTPYEVAYRTVLWHHQQSYEESRYDFDAILSIFPNNEVLALLCSGCPAVQPIWEALPAVESFPCWMTDETPTVSSGEWRVRSAFWEDALSNNVPRLQTDCFGRYGLPVPEPGEVAMQLPERHARAELLAADQVLARWLRKRTAADEHVPYVVLEGLQWLRTREGHAEVAAVRETIEEVLPLIDVPMLTCPPA